MSDSNDPVPEIVGSGREVVPEDVEVLWSDLIDGRRTSQETATRARSLMEAANATHVANWGLSSLYALTHVGTQDAEALVLAHEARRQHVREYEADPGGWDRRYYQRMIAEFAKNHGDERARHLGARLVDSGELRPCDVDAALTIDSNPTGN